MLSDEQLIQRIRSSLQAEAADVHPRANLLATVRRDYTAMRDRRRTPRLGGVLTSLAAGSAVAIAALAIVLLGHQRSPHTGVSAVPPEARALVSELAILRRPQSAEDRSLPAWAIRGQTYGSSQDNPLPSLTRLAAALPAPPTSGATLPKGTKVPPVGPVRIFLIVQPASSSSTRNPSSPSADALVTALVISNSTETGTHSVTASQVYTPINMIPGTGPTYFSGPGYNVGIVPDGVARVRWVFNGQYGFVKKHRRPFATYPTIQHNVATAPIQRNQGFVISVTWYSADGRVIKQVSSGSTP